MSLTKPLFPPVAVSFSLALAVGACDVPDAHEESLEAQSVADETDAAPLAATAAEASLRTLNDIFLDIEDEVPGFGGLFHEPDEERLYVWIAPQEGAPASLADVQAAIERHLPGEVPRRGVVVLDGEFAWSELMDAFQRLDRELLMNQQVSLVDADERGNLVRVGVADETTRLRVAELVDQLGYTGMVDVSRIEMPEVQAIVHLQTTRLSGISSGFQIATGGSWCTYGFAATVNGVNGFITNSHCSPTHGPEPLNAPAYAYQPTNAFAASGVESIDPTWGSCGTKCFTRNSDAAFFRYINGSWGRKRVGWPALGGSLSFDDAKDSDADGILDNFRAITAVGGTPTAGTMVNKVGRTTGRTRGSVFTTAATITTIELGADGVFTAGVDRQWKVSNSYQAYATSGGGDSGSPVVTDKGEGNGSENPGAILHGVHFAGNGSSITFSVLGGINQDFSKIGAGTLSGMCVSGC